MRNIFNSSSRHAQGLAIAFTAVLILSVDTILIRKLGNVPNFVVIFYKYFLFSIPLLLYLLSSSGINGTIEKFKSVGPYGWLAGFIWGTGNLLITYGFQISDVATVLVIVASNPMFAALFSYILLREPVPWYTTLAGFVCFGAIVLIFYSELTGSSDPNVGGLLAALGCSVATGLYFVLLRFIDIRSNRPSGSLDPMPCNIIAGLFSAVIALIVEPNQSIPNSMSGLYLFLDGVVVVGISFSLLNLCPSMISATEVSLMMLVQTGVGPVFVYLAGYESPPSSAIYGGCALAVALIGHSYIALRYESSSISAPAVTDKQSRTSSDAKLPLENTVLELSVYDTISGEDTGIVTEKDSADLQPDESKRQILHDISTADSAV